MSMLQQCTCLTWRALKPPMSIHWQDKWSAHTEYNLASASLAAAKSAMWGLRTASMCSAKAFSCSDENTGGAPPTIWAALLRHFLQAQMPRHLGHQPWSYLSTCSGVIAFDSTNFSRHLRAHLQRCYTESQKVRLRRCNTCPVCQEMQPS